MDYLTRKFEVFKQFIFKKQHDSPTKREITRFELYSEYIFDILSWKDIAQTLKVFLCINFAFWIFVSWNMKLYGILFTSILIFFLWDSYFQSKHPDGFTSQYCEGYNEFCNNIQDMFQSIIKYRKENHVSFCFCNCVFFFVFYIVTKSIPDYVLLYLMILGTFFTPLAFQCLPEETILVIKQTFSRLGYQAVLAEEELMPFISNKKFDNQDPDLDSLLTDRTQDSLTNSLTTGITSMPSYLDVNDEGKALSFTPTKGFSDSETDTDSEHKEIHFHSKHFNGNSSSEDENQYIKGLRFSQDLSETTTQEGLGGLLSQIGATIVTNMMSRSVPASVFQRTNSSSDSEFEMINEDEVDEKSS